MQKIHVYAHARTHTRAQTHARTLVLYDYFQRHVFHLFRNISYVNWGPLADPTYRWSDISLVRRKRFASPTCQWSDMCLARQFVGSMVRINVGIKSKIN